jgi:hypothetical protein
MTKIHLNMMFISDLLHKTPIIARKQLPNLTNAYLQIWCNHSTRSQADVAISSCLRALIC